jgi:hypothetical protein
VSDSELDEDEGEGGGESSTGFKVGRKLMFADVGLFEATGVVAPFLRLEGARTLAYNPEITKKNYTDQVRSRIGEYVR